MSRFQHYGSSFAGGELSPRLDGRIDLDKYAVGASIIENMIVTVQGPARRRGGTHYTDTVLDEAYRSWFMRFVFSFDQAFLIEFNNNRIAFFTDHGRLLAVRTITGAADNGGGLVRITSAAHGFLDGQEVTIAAVGGVPGAIGTFTIDYINANTFDLLASTFGGSYTSGGTATAIYMLASPYLDADLENDDGAVNLSYFQSADVVYIAGGAQPPQKLSRSGNTNWAIEEYDPEDGPYMAPNITENKTVYASAASGSVTLTASLAIFTANHIGALIRIEVQDLSSVLPWEADKAVALNDLRRSDGKTYKALVAKTTGSVRPTHTKGTAYDGSDDNVKWQFQDPGYGVARITAFTSTTIVTATVLKQMPAALVGSGTPSFRWQFGAWGDHNEQPIKVSKWRERLSFIGSRAYLSVVADYESHAPDDEGQQTFESAINVELGTAENEAARWIQSADALLVGTASAEVTFVPQTDADPVGPANIKNPQRSAFGGRDTPSVKLGDAIAMIDKSGKRVREIGYDSDTGVYASRDLTVLADHILDSPGIDLTFQASPDPTLWAVRLDGVVAGLTYEKEQEVFGWHRQILGGGGIVEDAETLPSPDGTKEDLWLAVRRTIGGVTRRYVEWMDHGLQRDESLADAFYVDCGLSYSGAPTAVLIADVAISQVDPAHPFPKNFQRIVETTAAHRLLSGDSVTISGVVATGDYLVNGTWPVTVIDATHFKIGKTNVPRDPIGSYTSGGTFTSPAHLATTFTGLGHAEGLEVSILADGGPEPNQVVVGGAVTIAKAASRVHIGLPFVSRLRTMRIEAGGDFGPAQGAIKRIDHVTVRFLDSLGCKAGPDWDRLDEFDFRSGADLMDSPPPLFSGDYKLSWPGGYETDGYLCFQQDQPLPLTIAALMPDGETARR